MKRSNDRTLGRSDRGRFLAVAGMLLSCLGNVALALPLASLGPSENSAVLPPANPRDFCAEATLQQHDDGVFEFAFAWESWGNAPPDWGAWAECYDADFVCGIEFLFSRAYEWWPPALMDVYVWADDGQAPPNNNPGAVIYLAAGVDPGEIAVWPEISTHQVQVCCPTGGPHFVGFWGNWVDSMPAWYLAVDVDGPAGCPRTKVYLEGWQRPDEWTGPLTSLGIREYDGPGDCVPTPAVPPTWGAVKAMFRR